MGCLLFGFMSDCVLLVLMLFGFEFCLLLVSLGVLLFVWFYYLILVPLRCVAD